MKLHSRHNFKSTKPPHILKVVLIALVFLALGYIAPSLFEGVSRVVLYPVHATHEWFRTSQARLPMYLKGQTDLINRISELENELAIASGTDLTTQRLYEENVWLRQLLGVDQNARIAAAVIARPAELPYDLLQIDKGSDDGIKEGAPVYIGIDNVIGVVSHVTPTYAFIQLFTTPGFTITTFISGADVVATMEGYGSGIARVRVPQGIPLAVGNLVHIPGITPGVFGRIEYLENRPSQPEQYGYIALPKPVSGIHYVAVAKDIVSPSEPPVIEERIKNILTKALLIDTGTLNLASTTIIGTSTATTTP
jgi:cell shape-determining protein MreC